MIDLEVASPPQVAEHPSPEALRDFMAGKLSWAATKGIVRHLLAGCWRCTEVTRQIWDFTEEELDPAYGSCGEENHDS